MKSSDIGKIDNNTRIYKEECVHCFANTRSPGGINVCLRCFSSACDAHASHHANLHPGHSLSLNIQQIGEFVNDNPDGSAPPQKLTKIAIGVEGGADFGGSVKWRTESYVRQWPGGHKIDQPASDVAAVAAGVLAAVDTGLQADAKSWEKKLNPCEHTLTLQQEPLGKVGASCYKCDLKKPLWLCLTCGNLGCGRPLPPPLTHEGGNGHAMEHRRQFPDHVLVAKMGTITPDGKGDVYCYGCDDDVVDDGLADHLAVLGILVANQKKTELTMNELELERNKLLDLLSTEDGAKLQPVFGPGYTGLRNIGNTCYLNSVVQAFFSLPEVQREYFDNVWKTHNPKCKEIEGARCYLCQMGKLANGLLSGSYSQAQQNVSLTDQEKRKQEHSSGVAPRMWKQLLTRGSMFESMQQQDSYEFMQFMLKKITENERRVGGGVNPARLFSFDLVQRVQCLTCHGCRYANEKGAMDLSLGIPLERAAPPVAEAPAGETAAERMTRHYKSEVPFQASLDEWLGVDGVQFNCPKCKTTTQAAKSQRFATFPNILVVQMRRFTFENWAPQKLSVRVSGLENSGNNNHPVVLDLSKLERVNNANEVLLEGGAEAAADKPLADPNIVAQLEAMGFSKVQCERAAFETKNVGVEEAMNYVFAHMEDGSLDVPLPKATKAAPSGPALSQESIDQLSAMGFTEGQARQALRECGGNVERGLDWLFSHPEATGEEPAAAPAAAPEKAEEAAPDNRPKTYQLIGFILHKGNQIQSGHYVVYLWSEEKKHWILYDDERVALSEKPPIDQAYVYFWRRV